MPSKRTSRPSSSSSVRTKRFHGVTSGSSLGGGTCMPGKNVAETVIALHHASRKFATSCYISVPAIAATRIQRVWRLRFRPVRFSELASRFLTREVGVPVSYAREIGFVRLCKYLRDASIISVSKRCLQRLHALCFHRHGFPSSIVTSRFPYLKAINVRMFLAAYLTALFPMEIFDRQSSGSLLVALDPVERSLLDVSVRLSIRFERILLCATKNDAGFHGVPAMLTAGFLPMLMEFMQCFMDWRGPDRKVDAQKQFVRTLDTLYDWRCSLVDCFDQESSKTKEEIEAQLVLVRGKLVKVFGDAALVQYDEERQKQSQERMGRPGAQPVAAVTNEQFVHELFLNPFFRMNEQAHGLVGRSNSVAHGMFEDVLIDGLFAEISVAEAVPVLSSCWSRVLAVLDEIRHDFADTFWEESPADVLAFKELVDTDLIRQQLNAGGFGWEHWRALAERMQVLLKTRQQPTLAEEMQGAWDNLFRGTDGDQPARVFCNVLRFFRRSLRLMRVDVMNQRLERLVPIVWLGGVDYERDKFQAGLKSGTIRLERTERWLRHALHGMGGGDWSGISVYASGIMALVERTEPVKAEDVPETLSMDLGRIRFAQTEFASLADRAAVFALGCSVIGSLGARKERAIVQELAKLLASDTSPELNVGVVWDGALDNAGILLEPGIKDSLLRVMQRGVCRGDSVRNLSAERIRKLWVGRIVLASSRITEFAMAPSLVPRLEQAALEISNFTGINIAVHSAVYSRLLGAERVPTA